MLALTSQGFGEIKCELDKTHSRVPSTQQVLYKHVTWPPVLRDLGGTIAAMESSFENQVETSAEYLAQGLQSKFLLRGNWLAFCTLCLPGKEGSPGRWKRSKPAG